LAPGLTPLFAFFAVQMEDESEDEYSDDDDMSWKVRRAAAKCLEAVITTRHELIDEFYKTVSLKLIARYLEPEIFYKRIRVTRSGEILPFGKKYPKFNSNKDSVLMPFVSNGQKHCKNRLFKA
jgi:hypothetical protein